MLRVFIVQNDVFERAVFIVRYNDYFGIKWYLTDIKK